MKTGIPLAALALMLFVSLSFGEDDDTDERFVGPITIESDGKITVFPEGGMWNGMWKLGCYPGFVAAVYIIPSQSPEELWLSTLLTAKATGRKVQFRVNCGTTTPNVVEMYFK